MEKPLTVVIKPTRDCNLRCKYCSVGDPDSSYMTEEIVESTIEKIANRIDECETKFIWHGGEPLLSGIKFYEHVLRVQKPLIKKGQRIRNTIQTNGTLINDKWAEFFKNNNFGVGLSIDGPKNVNDKTRVFEGNIGAFESIERGSKILSKHKVNHGYLAVISRHNVDKIDEIIDFMKDNKKTYKLVGISPIGRAAEAMDSLMMEEGNFSASQIRLFNRWMAEGDGSQKSALWKYVVPVLTGEPIECLFYRDCQQSFIGVDSNGDVYPCGRFCGSGEFMYGNIVKNSFKDIWNNPLRLKMTKRHKNLEEDCQECNHNEICGGGCPMQGYLNGGIYKKDYNCGEYKKIFSAIETRIRKEIKKKKSGKMKL
jgi:uncharacterized protein